MKDNQMIKSNREKIVLSDKEKAICAMLINRNDIIAILSSSACEGDDKEFKNDYGVSIERARKAMFKLTKYLILM